MNTFRTWNKEFDLLYKSPYSVQIQENTDQKKFGNFSRSENCNPGSIPTQDEFERSVVNSSESIIFID